LKDKLTSIRGNFYMNHLLKNELDSIRDKVGLYKLKSVGP
jgi:hypothetical protein